nr:hypothetical protein [Tanacetum cinerariifolium]
EDGSLKECGDRFGLDSYEVEVFPNVEEKSLVDGVLVGAFGGVREDDAVICDDVEVHEKNMLDWKPCKKDMKEMRMIGRMVRKII